MRNFLSCLILITSALWVSACGDSNEYTVGVIRPLQVVSLSPSGDFPSGGADNIARDTVLSVVFSDDVSEETLVDGLALESAGQPVTFDILYDAETYTATLTPSQLLDYTALYTVRISNAVHRKEDGAVLAQIIEQVFKTEDPAVLQISSVSPSDKGVSAGTIVDADGNVQPYGDAVSLQVTMQFSEGLDVDSLAEGAFQLVRTTDETVIAGTIEYLSSDVEFRSNYDEALRTDDILVFTPDAFLDLSTDYAIVVSSAVDQLRSARATTEAGWILPQSQTFVFSTPDPAVLSLVASTPSNGANGIGRLVHQSGGVITDTAEAERYGNAVSHDIVLVFSESVDADSFANNVTVYVADENGIPTATVVEGIWVSSSQNTLEDPWEVADTWTFTPAALWDLSGNYVVVISPELRSYRYTERAGWTGKGLAINWENQHPAGLSVLYTTPSTDGTDVGQVTASGYGNLARFEVLIRFSESVSADSTGKIQLLDADTGADLTGGMSIVLESTGVQPWQQNDQIRVYNSGTTWAENSLSKNLLVRIDETLASARATTESGSLPNGGFAFAWDIADPYLLYLEKSSPGDGSMLANSSINTWSTAAYNTISAGDGITDQTITLWFSEAVSRSSVESNLTVYDSDNLALPRTLGYTSGDTEVTITIDSTLALSADYRIHLNGGSLLAPFAGIISSRGSAVQTWYNTDDDTGGYLDGTIDIQFTTPDPEDLRVDSISPAAETVGGYSDQVSLGTSIVVVFSEPVSSDVISNTASYVALATDGSGLAVPATYAWSGSNTTLTIDPIQDLAYTTIYRITLQSGPAGGIDSWRATNSGGWLVPNGDIVYRFKTRDPNPFAVIAVSPSDQGNSVENDANIQIIFNRAVDVSSLSTPAAYGSFAGHTVYLSPATDSTMAVGATMYTTTSAKVVLKPTVGLDFGKTYTLTIKGGDATQVRAQDYTVEDGFLVTDVTATFKTNEFPPFYIVDSSPGSSDNISTLTDIDIELSNHPYRYSIDATDSVNNDYPSNTTIADGYTPNFILLKGDYSDAMVYPNPETLVASAITASYSYDAGTKILTLDPKDPLDLNTDYTYVISDDLLDENKSNLTGNSRYKFTTRVSSFVDTVSPADGATGQDLDVVIDVVFGDPVSQASVNSGSFYMTYEDQWGRVHLVPGSISFPTASSARFTPTKDWINCADTDTVLAYGTTYTLYLKSTIHKDGAPNDRFTGGMRWSFTTRTSPSLTSIYAANAKILDDSSLAIRTLSAGTVRTEVPVNSSYYITYSDDIDAIPADSAYLVRADNGDQVGLTAVQTGSNTIRYDISAAPACPSHSNNYLCFGKEYELVIEGYADGVTLINGGYINGDQRLSFETSPQTTYDYTPVAGGFIEEYSSFSLVFNRVLDLETVVDTTMQVYVSGQRHNILISPAGNKKFVVLRPSPFMESATGVTLLVNSGITDYLGNPVVQETNQSWGGPTNSNASGSQAAPIFRCETVADVLDTCDTATNISGLPDIQAQFGTSNGDRIQANSVNAVSYQLLSGGSQLDAEYGFVIDATRDIGTLTPDNALTGGATYTIRVIDNTIAAQNNKQLGSVADEVFTVENTPIDITATLATPADGSTNVDATQVLTIVFDEKVDSTTLIPGSGNNWPNGATTVVIRKTAGTAEIAGTWSLADDLITYSFTPDNPWEAGVSYTVDLRAGTNGNNDGIVDIASNTTGTQTSFSSEFTIEANAPDLIGATPASGGVTTGIIVTLQFNEAMDLSTFTSGTTTSAASVDLSFLTGCGTRYRTYGCFSASADMTEIYFEPHENLVGDISGYALSLTEASLTDLAGNAATLGIFSNPVRSYSTASDTPVATCVLPANDSILATSSNNIEIFFNESMDSASFDSSTVTFFDADTGTQYADATTATFAPDGKTVTMPTNAALPAASTFELWVGPVEDSTDGTAMRTDVHLEYTTP